MNNTNNDCMYTTQGNLICKEKSKNDSYPKKSTFVNFPVYSSSSESLGINTHGSLIDQDLVIPKVKDFNFN
jgi:hypothetical protein